MAEGEFLRVGEARELLGINKVRMAKYIKDGILPAFRHGPDARVKWVRRGDVLKLRATFQGFDPITPKAEAVA